MDLDFPQEQGAGKLLHLQTKGREERQTWLHELQSKAEGLLVQQMLDGEPPAAIAVAPVLPSPRNWILEALTSGRGGNF